MGEGLFELDKEEIKAIEEAEELGVVSKNARGQVRITRIVGDGDSMIRQDKNENRYLMFFLEVVDPEGNFKDIMHMLYLPSEGETEKKKMENKRAFRVFHEAFGIKLSQEMNEDDYIGMEADCIFGVGKDQEGNPNNRITRWL